MESLRRLDTPTASRRRQTIVKFLTEMRNASEHLFEFNNFETLCALLVRQVSPVRAIFIGIVLAYRQLVTRKFHDTGSHIDTLNSRNPNLSRLSSTIWPQLRATGLH